jgi:putative hydrolase of the HAD superfamily
VRFLLFDLDETLYPTSTGVFNELRGRIGMYMQERQGIPPDEVSSLRLSYLERYGTTLRGLQTHHDVDTEEYLQYVHDFDVSAYLQPNPDLERALGSLRQEKIVFTNATTEYAQRVLQVLGIAHHFRRTFDIRAVRFHCKPDPRSYDIVLEALRASGPECLLIEDKAVNLRGGKDVGMHTLLVGRGPGTGDHIDFAIDDIVQVGEIVRILERRADRGIGASSA